MRFFQIIEFSTGRIDELNAALDEWLAQTQGTRAASRGTQTRDRDRDHTYLQIVEFPYYEQAMANSALPSREMPFEAIHRTDRPAGVPVSRSP